MPFQFQFSTNSILGIFSRHSVIKVPHYWAYIFFKIRKKHSVTNSYKSRRLSLRIVFCPFINFILMISFLACSAMNGINIAVKFYFQIINKYSYNKVSKHVADHFISGNTYLIEMIVKYSKWRNFMKEKIKFHAVITI